MKIGPYELSSIEAGQFALDGGAMYGVVPRSLWERQAHPDDQNRIGMALRALLIEEIEGERKILVDTGIGRKWDEKKAKIFSIDHSRLELERSLAARGVGTGDITHVLLTHLHFDHAGGATKDASGTLVPTFENARYYVQKENLAWAQNPTEKDRASYLPENFEPLLREGVLETLDGPGLWAEGIELIVHEGHTRSMQLVHVFGAEGHLVYCADTIPTASHIPVPWVMAYDNHPLTTIEEKKALLGRAYEENWILFFEHDPHGPAARLAPGSRGYSAGERVEL